MSHSMSKQKKIALLVAHRAPMLAILLLLCSVVARAEVFVTSTPDGGLQPRLVTAADGGVHLLYFKKRLSAPSAREGNLYYREYHWCALDTDQVGSWRHESF